MTKQEFFNLISIKSGYSTRTIETIYNSILHTAMVEYKINNQFTLPSFLTMVNGNDIVLDNKFKKAINTKSNINNISISQFSNLSNEKANLKIDKENSIDKVINASIKYQNTLRNNSVKDCWYCLNNKKYYKTIKQIENDLGIETRTLRNNFQKGLYKWKNYKFTYVPYEKVGNDFEVYNTIIQKDKPIDENYLQKFIIKDNN